MVDKIYSTVRRGIYMACCVLLACQAPIVSGIATDRYILEYIPPWGKNLALVYMVWFCLLSSVVTINGDLHLEVTLINNFTSDKTRATMDPLDLLLVFIFGVAVVFGSHKLLELTSRNIMGSIDPPSSVLYAVTPVSGLAFTIATIDRGRTLLCRLK